MRYTFLCLQPYDNMCFFRALLRSNFFEVSNYQKDTFEVLCIGLEVVGKGLAFNLKSIHENVNADREERESMRCSK